MLSVIFLLFLCCQSQGSVWDTLTANIAVVEYNSKFADTLQSTELEYLKIMSEAVDTSENSLDMIVFPESTLPLGREDAQPVDLNTTPYLISNSSSYLYDFSAAAKNYSSYLIINTLERENCKENDQSSSNCKKYGARFYNTDVVFDRKGTIVNRYRKFNLFGEASKDKPETADLVVIDTDFGAKFGIFTCFDIMFKTPAQDLLSLGVDGIIFPTMWFSELPFLTALQAQHMWSQAHNITFFSAGANQPLVGSGGTGVFRGAKGIVTGGIIGEGGTKTYIYKSRNGQYNPSSPEDVDVVAKEMDNFYLKRDKSVDSYSSTILDTSAPDTTTQLCYEEKESESSFCCSFHIKLSAETPSDNLNYYTYRLVSYAGVRSFDGVYNGGIEICAIIACLNDSLSSCGYRFPKYEEVQWPITFEEITVTGDFDKNGNKTQFPNSLLSSIRPIEVGETEWKSEENEETVRRSFSTKTQTRILSFGIFGRNFENDSPPSGNGGGDNGIDDNNSESHVRGINYILLISLVILITRKI